MKSGAGAGEVIKITWPHYVQMMEIMEPVLPTPSLHTNLDFYGEMRKWHQQWLHHQWYQQWQWSP
ncbi:unnamed protein product, partial [Ixodes persulcatus]